MLIRKINIANSIYWIPDRLIEVCQYLGLYYLHLNSFATISNPNSGTERGSLLLEIRDAAHTLEKEESRRQRAAQGDALQKSHTKRQQIEDEEGWTYVVELGKGKKLLPLVKVAEKEQVVEKFLIGDFENAGVSYINRTLEKLRQDLRFYTRLWEEWC
jgi:hypothetical protein